MSPTVKILFYAINGTGLGHLNRQLVLARSTRELLHCQGLKADFRFLTTSEADQVAWDFPTYKLPSKTVVGESDVITRSFSAQAKLLISNMVAGFRPDILVMDTLPQGSYQEFLFLKDYAHLTVFIDRHKDLRIRRGATHGATLALYDLIITPDHADQTDQYPIPGNMEEKRVFTGPIHSFQPEQAWSRERVRAYFGVEHQQSLTYVSTGGGGDPLSAAQMRALVETCAADPNRFVIAGYGPLYRGERVYARNVAALCEPDAWRFFAGLDSALCSAGYNSWNELLEAEVVSAFFAQNKGMDRQDLRIHGGVQAGWHLQLDAVAPAQIKAMLARLEDPEERIRIGTALAERQRGSGRLRAALALLRLHASLPHSAVQRNELARLALWRQAWADTLASLPRQEPLPDFCETWLHDQSWTRVSRSNHERAILDDLALNAWELGAETALRPRQALIDGIRLAQLRRTLDLSEPVWTALVKAYGHDLAGKGQQACEAGLIQLCHCLEGFAESGDAARALLDALVPRVLRADLPEALAQVLGSSHELASWAAWITTWTKRRIGLDDLIQFAASTPSCRHEPELGGT